MWAAVVFRAPHLGEGSVYGDATTGPEPGIVMLTAKASENDRVAGLRLGADDYVVKPFSPRELVARVEAVLRCSGTARTDISTEVAYGGGRLRIDGERREVRVDGALVALTRSEFDLLAASPPGPDARGYGSSSSAASRATHLKPMNAPSTCT